MWILKQTALDRFKSINKLDRTRGISAEQKLLVPVYSSADTQLTVCGETRTFRLHEAQTRTRRTIG